MLQSLPASILLILLGFALLVWAADRFIVGASSLAKLLGVSTLVIGVTVVGFGTSLPEMVVSAMAAWHGTPALAVGNAIGSNITNIGLVLGVTALLKPLAIHSKVLKREFPLLFIIMIFAWIVLSNGYLGRVDGIILFAGLLGLIYWMFHITLGSKEKEDPFIVEIESEPPQTLIKRTAVFWLLIGMIFLLISSRILIFAAVNIAKGLGVSDLVIGLTIVALGTSLPELAASITGALKNEPDIAIGNIMGSNMFNLLGVLAMPGLLHPAPLDRSVLIQDFPIMFGLTIALYLTAHSFRNRPPIIHRWEGALLFLGYISYIAWIY